MSEHEFFSRSGNDEIKTMLEMFRNGIFFVERKSDQKWLTPLREWTNDPLKAMRHTTKPDAELELIRAKLDSTDEYLVTEHEFIEPTGTH